MSVRMFVPAIVSAVLLSAPAWAAGDKTASMETCKQLEAQFDHINPNHPGDNPTDVEARKMRAEGAKLCSAGKAAEGAKEIRDALAKWGVTPHA